MRKSTSTPTPAQVYRYAVQAFQPHLKLSNAKGIAAETILTVLFAAAARISSLSDTCRRLRDVPDEHAVAEALYSTLPEYDRLRRRVQAALSGHLPKALRRRHPASAPRRATPASIDRIVNRTRGSLMAGASIGAGCQPSL